MEGLDTMIERLQRPGTDHATGYQQSRAFVPKLLTVLQEGYGGDRLRGDVLAGLTVAIVALPLAMALGIASGASPDKGLITAIVAGLFISALGGSRVQIGGPTGAFVVVVYGVIARHGYDGLLLATLMAGAILIIAGYSGFGRLIRFVPHPVVTGFTAGIAVIIAASQIRDFLGLPREPLSGSLPEQMNQALHLLSAIDPATAGVGVAALLLLIVMKRFTPKLPAYLIAILLFSTIVMILAAPVDTIGSRFPEMNLGLPFPAVPPFSLAKIEAVLPAAFTIAFLAGIEALLSAVVADGMTGFQHRSNQELVGQGFANIASSLFGGLPATGAIARTATNIRAGGTTPFSGIFHALFLLLFVLLAGRLMQLVPMAVLAAILLIVAWGMSEAGRFISLLQTKSSERWILLVTFGLTVMVDLAVAIGVGVTLASLNFLARMSETVTITGGGSEIGEDPEQRGALPAGVEVFRINGPLFFGVTTELIEALKRIGEIPRTIILRLELVPWLDSSGSAALHDFLKRARTMGSDVILCSMQPGVREALHRIEIGDATQDVQFAPDYATALRMAQGDTTPL
ncbi:MAG: SulP family inorganic anion transporter [Sphingomonadaceae bacterium]